jgi:GxxExxY protein
MSEEDHRLTGRVIGCVIRVHQELGPGFLEGIYRRALVLELNGAGIAIEAEKEIVVTYHGQEVGRHRLDLLVEAQLVLELKTVEDLSRAHYAQVRSYLKATGLQMGLLVNFSNDKADWRKVEPTPQSYRLRRHLASSN